MSTLIQVILLGLLFGTAHEAAQQSSRSNGQPSNLILGLLEDHPGARTGEPSARVIRVVFEKRGSEWRSFPNECDNEQSCKSLSKLYPKDMIWTVAFDGRDLGRVTAHALPKLQGHDIIGYEEITNPKTVPTIGKKLEKYSGFLFTPVYRPLVTVSQPNFSDPDSWGRSRLSPELISAVRRQFRSRFPTVTNCKNPNEGIPKPWKYGDENIEVSTAYSSKHNWSLVELRLAGWACDGPQEEGSAFTGQWFVIEPSGVTRFLGADMWLVDAGDYDDEGKSEVLFAIVGYNKGGYRLFYQDFNKSAEFVFRYH